MRAVRPAVASTLESPSSGEAAASAADTEKVDLLRCPGCSAALRPDAQWCSLCYRDLRKASEPVSRTSAQPAGLASSAAASPVPPEQRPVVESDGGTPSGAPASAGWPCPDCSTLVSLDSDVCSACGAPFLARLAGSDGRHRAQAGGGTLARLPRTARLIVGTVLGLFLAVLVPVLLALFG